MEKTLLPSAYSFVGIYKTRNSESVDSRGKTFTLLSLPHLACLLVLHPGKARKLGIPLCMPVPAADPGLCCSLVRTARDDGQAIC